MILLTQLRNESRVSESIEFLQNITKSPKVFATQGEVRVRKCKRYKVRLMVLPEELHSEKKTTLKVTLYFC